MSLFGGSRDICLFNNLSKELMNDIIQSEVGYYKFALEKTSSNVYGESQGKVYYEPVRIASLIVREDQKWSSNDFGPNIAQILDFRFLKNELISINLVPEVGDILLFRNNFYEVDGKIENQLIVGKDPDYAISTGTTDFGSSFSVIVSTYMSGIERLNLIPLRGGKYPSTTKITDGTANLLG